MSRVLRRPMFRGGDTGGGITTGLGRQGFKEGNLARVQSQLALIDQLAPRQGSNLNNFLINWGLNMVGNPPTGNIFQNRSKTSTRSFPKISSR